MQSRSRGILTIDNDSAILPCAVVARVYSRTKDAPDPQRGSSERRRSQEAEMAQAAGDSSPSALRTGPVEPVPTTAQTAAIVGSDAAPRRVIGGSGLSVFPVAISGKTFGSAADDATAGAILDAYAAHGGNIIDTADSYSGGRSEAIIGDWMRSRSCRDDTVVATKVGRGAEHPGVDARSITAAVEASLRRLRTDRIELLFLHVDDPEVPFEETLLAVDELIRAGKVLAFGASEHSGNRLFEARIASAQLGVAPMAALQTPYNLMERRDFEGDLEHIVERVGLGVMPRFALANGFLSGRYRAKADFAASDRAAEVIGYFTRTGVRVLAALDGVAGAHDAALATIALAWLLSKPNVVAPVVSASSPEQVFDLVAAPQVRLTRHELTQLDRASEPRR
jgi:aryl-alcohol dehydrogenase-like predicted oxidoreductase